jgi:hypothetical protein
VDKHNYVTRMIEEIGLEASKVNDRHADTGSTKSSRELLCKSRANLHTFDRAYTPFRVQSCRCSLSLVLGGAGCAARRLIATKLCIEEIVKIKIKIKKVQSIQSSCGIYSVKHNPIFTRYPLPSSHFTQ